MYLRKKMSPAEPTELWKHGKLFSPASILTSFFDLKLISCDTFGVCLFTEQLWGHNQMTDVCVSAHAERSG